MKIKVTKDEKSKIMQNSGIKMLNTTTKKKDVHPNLLLIDHPKNPKYGIVTRGFELQPSKEMLEKIEELAVADKEIPTECFELVPGFDLLKVDKLCEDKQFKSKLETHLNAKLEIDDISFEFNEMNYAYLLYRVNYDEKSLNEYNETFSKFLSLSIENAKGHEKVYFTMQQDIHNTCIKKKRELLDFDKNMEKNNTQKEDISILTKKLHQKMDYFASKKSDDFLFHKLSIFEKYELATKKSSPNSSYRIHSKKNEHDKHIMYRECHEEDNSDSKSTKNFSNPVKLIDS